MLTPILGFWYRAVPILSLVFSHSRCALVAQTYMSRLSLGIAVVAGLFLFTSVRAAEDVFDGSRPSAQALRYDAVGRLIRNRPAGNGAQASNRPPYVLVDKNGKPRCYITPEQGVDVADLVNLRVGVRGSVRNLEGDPLPNIIARRVRAVAEQSATAQAATTAQPAVQQASAEVPVQQQSQQRVSVDPNVTPASHVQPVNMREELPAPQPQPDPAYSPRSQIQGGEVIHGNPMPDQGMQYDPNGGPAFYDGGDGVYQGPQGDGCFGPSCPHGNCGGIACVRCAPCCNANDPGLWWVRGEALYWSTSGMSLPPLVTTSPTGTPLAEAGVLGEPGTTILFGNQSVNGDARWGSRLSFGRWLDCCQTWGISGEYFALQDQSTDFIASGVNGAPIIMRPFFDVLGDPTANPVVLPGNSAEIVSYPDTLEGSVAVQTQTSFQGAGALLRYNICCKNMCWQDCCCNPCGGGIPGGIRVGVVGGYRFMRLDDSLKIRENLTTLDTEDPESIIVRDNFSTRNQFNGGEVGMIIDGRAARWTVELSSKIAVGNNHETTKISGSTTFDGTETQQGGLLAQRTNIGTYTRDQLAVIPQLGATLGYNVTRHLRFTVGYTFIYWSSVARAGDQVSLDVNPNLLPVAGEAPQNPLEGPARPAFIWRDNDFWAQGLSIGADYRF